MAPRAWTGERGCWEQVETEQARASLTKDADSILKALKAAGFEIERVTVQQAQPASNTAQAGTQGSAPVSSESGQEAAGIPDGSGSDLPQEKSPNDDGGESFDAG